MKRIDTQTAFDILNASGDLSAVRAAFRRHLIDHDDAQKDEPVSHHLRTCEFCGACTTSRIRTCCEKGRWTDSAVKPVPEQEKPKIVCLCGSCRFKDTFIEHYEKETDAGKIVLSVGCFIPKAEQELHPERKEMLDELHKRKIDLADEVLILNVGGYIGKSTASELSYAREHGKLVRFLEPETKSAPEQKPMVCSCVCDKALSKGPIYDKPISPAYLPQVGDVVLITCGPMRRGAIRATVELVHEELREVYLRSTEGNDWFKWESIVLDTRATPHDGDGVELLKEGKATGMFGIWYDHIDGAYFFMGDAQSGEMWRRVTDPAMVRIRVRGGKA